MQTHVTEIDPGESDIEWPDAVEIGSVGPIASRRRFNVTLAAALLLFGSVIGAGLWPTDSAAPIESPVGDCQPPSDAPPTDEGPASTPLDGGKGRRPSLVILIPARGEVVLGSEVIVAGRVVNGRAAGGRNLAPSLHGSVAIGDEVVGEADFSAVGSVFVGSISLPAPTQGEIAELRVTDVRRPGIVLFEQPFVIGPHR